MQQGTPGAPRLALVILAVRDLARSTAFYRAALGFETTVEVPVYVEMGVPTGMRLGLYARAGFGANVDSAPRLAGDGEVSGTELYFYPADLSAAIERIEAAGAKPLRVSRKISGRGGCDCKRRDTGGCRVRRRGAVAARIPGDSRGSRTEVLGPLESPG